MSGWIQLHRSLIDWEWYDDANTMRLFLHCCLRANFEDAKWRGIDIKRGTFITSIKTLSEELKLSESKIKLSIKKLKTTNEIATKTTNQNTTVTVCNYDTYNNLKKQNDKPNNNQPDNQTTNEQQTKDNQTATDKKNNNKKKEQKEQLDKDIQTVLSHLNQNTQSSYRVAGDLSARFNEGYTVEDALRVIDIKVAEWLGTEQQTYLRPKTLFCKGNFDGYLNQLPLVMKEDNKPQQHNLTFRD